MFQIDKTLISESIIDNDFVCNLSACKGACCVDGDAGAPLEKSEIEIIEHVYPKIKHHLSKESIKHIESQGKFITTDKGELETPLINGADCVYVIYDDRNYASCAFEEAYNQGEINWKKPISCHLYPVRVKQHKNFTSVNYDRWKICDSACSLGKELAVPIYSFVKEALIRKFGKKWYSELEIIAKQLKSQ